MNKFHFLTSIFFITILILSACESLSAKKTIALKTKNTRIANETVPMKDVPEWLKNGGSKSGFFCGMGSHKVTGNNVSFAVKVARKRALVDLECNLKTTVVELFEDRNWQVEHNRKVSNEEDVSKIVSHITHNDEQSSIDFGDNWSDSEYVYIILCIDSQRAYDIFNKIN
ncbi:hypothetical protein J6Z39_00025 [bacterium]|nr:hypothetical protein [bacterium]MBP5434191.1 hypothetical protein [bacterium]